MLVSAGRVYLLAPCFQLVVVSACACATTVSHLFRLQVWPLLRVVDFPVLCSCQGLHLLPRRLDGFVGLILLDDCVRRSTAPQVRSERLPLLEPRRQFDSSFPFFLKCVATFQQLGPSQRDHRI